MKIGLVGCGYVADFYAKTNHPQRGEAVTGGPVRTSDPEPVGPAPDYARPSRRAW